jgi:hypothetical protein
MSHDQWFLLITFCHYVTKKKKYLPNFRNHKIEKKNSAHDLDMFKFMIKFALCFKMGNLIPGVIDNVLKM